MSEEIKKLINTAKNELNYLEKNDANNLDDKYTNAGSNNYTKYARDCFAELQGLSWCCMFVWWCFEKAYGSIYAKKLVGEKTAKCSIMQERMQKLGCEKVEKPQVGDIVFFNSPISHIGIVYSVGSTSFTTIEGNTSQSKSVANVNEVVANGGGVFIRCYNYGISRINCFYRPLWGESESNEESTISKMETLEKNKYVIFATNVNIRLGAGTNYKKIGNETTGFSFTKLGEAKDSIGYVWYKFNYKNTIGWIRSDFVKIED